MEGRSVELQAIKSESESETLDRMGNNIVDPCGRWGVKQGLVDGTCSSDLTDPGGYPTASPVEGMFEFHAVKSEENPRPASRLVELAGGEQVTVHRVKDESDINDPCLAEDSLDSPLDPAQTSSPNHKSLVDVIIPTDYVEVKLEDDCGTQSGSQFTSSERSPRGSPSAKVFPGTSTCKKSLSGRRSDVDLRRPTGVEGGTAQPRKRPRSTAVTEANRKYGEMADAKLELVELQIAIAKNKLKRLKNGTSIEEAEANLRRTEHEIQLQTLKNKYEREVEKERLRAEISKIDVEIEKCILMKKRQRRDTSPNAR